MIGKTILNGGTRLRDGKVKCRELGDDDTFSLKDALVGFELTAERWQKVIDFRVLHQHPRVYSFEVTDIHLD